MDANEAASGGLTVKEDTGTDKFPRKKDSSTHDCQEYFARDEDGIITSSEDTTWQSCVGHELCEWSRAPRPYKMQDASRSIGRWSHTSK